MNEERLSIRKATRADAGALHTLHTASVTTLCASHYSGDVIGKWIEKRAPEGYYRGIDRDEMFVGELGGKVVGFGHAIPGEVVGVFVHPDHAARGVGSALLSHAIQMARSNHVGPINIVATLNAQSFYEKHGFVKVKQYIVQRNSADIPVVEMELEMEI
jgi:GNAT superfamily N-acetyltransferase